MLKNGLSGELPNNTHSTTRKTLNIFLRELIDGERGNLLKVILFGSVARGSADKDSDIDVLVILKEKNMSDAEKIYSISDEVKSSFDFDENAYLQPLIVSRKEMEGLDFLELSQNISREGIVLYDAG
jgi:predicted nucleotidyltransferase